MYFTFFSREAGPVAVIRLQPLRAYRLAFTFDAGFFHVIKQIFTQGLSEGFDSIHIESTESLEGIILNILLFIPFGYMLPYIQLLTHLGWFDLDDLMNNTVGCILGVIFYRIFLRERK